MHLLLTTYPFTTYSLTPYYLLLTTYHLLPYLLLPTPTTYHLLLTTYHFTTIHPHLGRLYFVVTTIYLNFASC